MLGGLLILFLLAQAGVPLTGGFIAKLEVFSAATGAGSTRWSRSARSPRWSRRSSTCASCSRCTPDTAEEEADAAPGVHVRIGHRVDLWTGTVLAVTAAMTLVLGIAPARVVDCARHASLML